MEPPSRLALHSKASEGRAAERPRNKWPRINFLPLRLDGQGAKLGPDWGEKMECSAAAWPHPGGPLVVASSWGKPHEWWPAGG